MENSVKNNLSDGLTIRDCFDRVFFQHLDRLIGSRYGIEGLPLNLVNVTCLILLTEQITDEMESFSNPPERHTRTSLFRELSDMGLTLAEDTEAILEDIIQKGYVEVSDTGTLSASKPTISMAQLLDRTFPKMPGLNLIASLAQPIDEIRSGRKDLETGLRFFDQILKMQGMSLSQQKTPAPSTRKETPSSETERKEREEIESVQRSIPSATQFQKMKLSDNYQMRMPRSPQSISSLQTTEKGLQTSPSEGLENTEIPPWDPFVSGGSPRENPALQEDSLSEDSLNLSSKTKEVLAEGTPDDGVEAAGEMEHERTSYPNGTADDEKGPEEASLADHPIPPTRELPSPSPLSEAIDVDRETDMQEMESDQEGDLSESECPVDDDDIEERIRKFEQTLSLQCPLCKTGVIHHETTSTGKVFYKCAGPDCNFISWGKPHHIQCPQCHNPFLVEIHRPNSASILKCPRATCNYWQDFASELADNPIGEGPDSSQKEVKVRAVVRRPKKRVVRRRVVRRKS